MLILTQFRGMIDGGDGMTKGLVNIGLTSLKDTTPSGKQLCCFVLKSKWKGFKLDVTRNCALGVPVGVPVVPGPL